MTPKEKAKELANRFYNEVKYMERAKECALVVVNELIKNSYFKAELLTLRSKGFLFINPLTDSKEYWQEIKEEIEKL